MDARRAVAVLLAATLLACGCRALWQPEELGPPSELPNQKLADDTVTLEIARVALSTLDEEKLPSIWSDIDEQAIPLEKRRELLANGFRVGIIDYHMPGPIRDIMHKSEGARGLNGEEMVRIDGDDKVAINHRRFRGGKRSEYIMVPLRNEVSILESVGGIIRGETFYQAECKFILKAFPQNDGRVQLVVSPEIHHGQPRQRYEAGEGMLRIETRKESKVLEQIEFSAMLQPGQTLIISGTSESKGLGQAYFERENGGSQRKQILLIRLAGTQFDDLFQTRDTVKENPPLNDDSMGGLLPSHFDEETGD
ncbi:hypothetical protein GC197_11645 [bacterium]|nr:hypothetical protein [bacterium]